VVRIKIIGTEVIGMTVCPCAQELMREKAAAGLMGREIAKKDMDAFWIPYLWQRILKEVGV